MPYINPFLAFQNEAETREAVALYVSLFPNGRIVKEIVFRAGDPGPEGALCALSFSLNGQTLTAIVGGPYFTKGPGISLYVNCGSQAEIDRVYDGLAKEGQEQACGWVTDKFGITWQIVPAEVEQYMNGGDPERAHRAMSALWKMKKLDAAAIKAAYEGA